MTRKHFKQLAQMIKDNHRLASVRGNPMHVIDSANFIDELCIFLKTQNPRFQEDLFREACGQIASQQSKTKSPARPGFFMPGTCDLGRNLRPGASKKKDPASMPGLLIKVWRNPI